MPAPLGNRGSVSNRSRPPGSGSGLEHETRSVLFETCPKLRPSASWRVKHSPVRINKLLSTVLGRPVSTSFRLCISGFTFEFAFSFVTDIGNRLTLVHQTVFSTCWPPHWAKWTSSHTLQHAEKEREWSINLYWSWIRGSISGDWFQASLGKHMASLVSRKGRENIATSSGTRKICFIYSGNS